jgi:hypothetical protein
MRGYVRFRPFNAAILAQVARIARNLAVWRLFAGLTIPLFPLLAQARGASTALVSSMFSLRALASTLVRIPFGEPRILRMRLAALRA